MKQIIIQGSIILLMSIVTYSQSKSDDYHSKVKTLDSTIETLYGVISGDAGVKRDWELFEFLFAQNAQLIPTRKNQEGNLELLHMSPSDYVERSGKWLEENGFFEIEISREVDTFGSMTQVFSSYASFRTSTDKEPFARGINSIQLMNDGTRWWIVNIYWVSESEDTPIPDNYLLKK